MKVKIISTAVAATLTLASLTTFAEDMYLGSWYVVSGLNYMDTDNDLEAEHGRGVFIKFGKEISQSWDIQGGVGYISAGEDTGISGIGGHYKQTTLGLDALYMFSREKLRPFLLVGLGAARNNVDYSHHFLETNAKKTSYLANIGFGAQYLFSDAFGLQADLRHQVSNARTTTNHGVLEKDTQTIGNNIFSLGAIFRFGAPMKVASNAAETPVLAPMRITKTMPEAKAEPVMVPERTAESAPLPVAVADPCVPKFETITLLVEKLFDFDDSKMQTGAKPVLDGIVKKLMKHPEFKLVVVEGHTDRIGNAEYNKNLSNQRATQVKDYLVAQGVEASRLQVVGMGESEPVVECNGIRGQKLIECLQPNRRVVISDQKQHEIMGVKGCN